MDIVSSIAGWLLLLVVQTTPADSFNTYQEFEYQFGAKTFTIELVGLLKKNNTTTLTLSIGEGKGKANRSQYVQSAQAPDGTITIRYLGAEVPTATNATEKFKVPGGKKLALAVAADAILSRSSAIKTSAISLELGGTATKLSAETASYKDTDGNEVKLSIVPGKFLSAASFLFPGMEDVPPVVLKAIR